MVDRKPRGQTPPEEEAFRSLIRAYGSVKRVMEPYFGGFGISGSQWAVLRTLQRAEDEGLSSMRLTDLGVRLLVKPPSVTGVVDRLTRLGLVSRNASSTDLRTKHVQLTAAGRDLIDHMLDGHRKRIGAIFNGLSPEERKNLQKMLDKVGCEIEHLS